MAASRTAYGRAATAGAVLLLLLVSAVAGLPAAAGASGWRDDFTSLDRSVWHVARSACKSPGNVWVSDGLLHLRTTPGSRPACDVVGGRIDTIGKRTFPPGQFSARIRFAPATGSWQTFWMTGASGEPFPANGEVDVAEVLGRAPDTNHVRVHSAYLDGRTLPDGRLERCTQKADLPVSGLDGWHIFSVRTGASAVTFRVDGVVVAQFGPNEECTWPFGDPMRIILDVGSGTWAGPVDKAQFPVTALVDWVAWRR